MPVSKKIHKKYVLKGQRSQIVLLHIHISVSVSGWLTVNYLTLIPWESMLYYIYNT